MPAFIGPLQIFTIDGGVVQFGDTAVISPKSSTKTSAGAGSFSVGAFLCSSSGISANNTLNTSLIDQPQTGNA